jgi:hypothetical protein
VETYGTEVERYRLRQSDMGLMLSFDFFSLPLSLGLSSFKYNQLFSQDFFTMCLVFGFKILKDYSSSSKLFKKIYLFQEELV